MHDADHYDAGHIEYVHAMRSAFGNTYVREFCLGNAFKYVWRCKYKGAMKTDVRKAIDYLSYALEIMEDNANDYP